MKHALALAAMATVACGEDRPAPRPTPTPVVAIDAGVTALPVYDPTAGFAIDPDPVARPAPRRSARDRKQVQLILRSTPMGALAAVDGVVVGPTPVVWDGEAAIAHEFTFVMAGHTLARYRFAPVTNGVVHGRLLRVASDEPVPTIPVPTILAPEPPPSGPPVVPPPPPAVAPAAVAPAAVAPPAVAPAAVAPAVVAPADAGSAAAPTVDAGDVLAPAPR